MRPAGLPWCLSWYENLPAVKETQLLSLSGEAPLEEERAAHSRILAWGIPWTEEPGGATVHGASKELDMTE